jgi:hypothetical protein
MASERWLNSARNIGVGLLAGVALSWVALGRTTPSLHAQTAGSAEATGTIAFTSGAAGSVQMLYLIDTKAQAFAVYRVDPQNGKGTIKLEAARQYRWDLKLAEYNNQPPDVASIESRIGSPPRK